MSKEEGAASQLLTTMSGAVHRFAHRLHARPTGAVAGSGDPPPRSTRPSLLGVVNVAPGSSTYSAAMGLCPHLQVGRRACVGRAGVAAPRRPRPRRRPIPHTLPRHTVRERGRRGARSRCNRRTPPTTSTLVPGLSASVVARPPVASTMPSGGERVASSGEAAARRGWVRPGLVRLVTPLAQHATAGPKWAPSTGRGVAGTISVLGPATSSG